MTLFSFRLAFAETCCVCRPVWAAGVDGLFTSFFCSAISTYLETCQGFLNFLSEELGFLEDVRTGRK
jgi:hypothetical protein